MRATALRIFAVRSKIFFVKSLQNSFIFLSIWIMSGAAAVLAECTKFILNNYGI